MRRAFTLVEVLAVMSVVAVLAALLLPAVGSALERGRSTQCVSNLRQLAAANLTYAADNESRFVAAQDEQNRVRWHGVRTSGTAAFNPAKGPLAPYLGHEGTRKALPHPQPGTQRI